MERQPGIGRGKAVMWIGMASALVAISFWTATTVAFVPTPKAAPNRSSFVGTGSSGYSGDGGQASAATLTGPHSLALDATGNLLIGDTFRLRRVNASGVISTIAGTGTQGFGGDGGPALSASFGLIADLAYDTAGNLFVADSHNGRIRRITPAGIITTVAGSGEPFGDIVFGGDGGPATAANLNIPQGIATAPGGVLYIADTFNNRVRKIDANGIITTIAGDGEPGYSGDGGLAVDSSLNFPSDVAVDRNGRVLIADTRNGRIRRIEADGTLVTIAGGGTFGEDPVALHARLPDPVSLYVDADGNLAVVSSGGLIRVSSDGGYELLTQLDNCSGAPCGADSYFSQLGSVVVDATGTVYVADEYKYKVSRITGYPAPAPLRGANAFAAPFNIPTGGQVDGVVVGDVNGDGRDDAVIQTIAGSTADPSVDNQLFIFLQDADGMLANPIKRAYHRISYQANIALGDMNNDGVLDVVVGHQEGLTLFPGGAGSNFNGVVYPSAYASSELYLDDTNDDGNLDAVSRASETQVVTYLGNGNLGISSTRLSSTGSAAGDMVSGDFNDDGWTDHAISSFSGGSGFRVFTRTATGTFDMGPLQSISPGSTNAPAGMFSGDLNADGRDDLGHLDPYYTPALWLHAQRQGTGLAATPALVETAQRAMAGRITDMNQDGLKDLLILHADSDDEDALGFYAGSLSGLAREVRYSLPHNGSPNAYASQYSMDTGDIDSDGCPDMAIANPSYGLLILHGTACRKRAGRRGDMSGDGMADVLWRNPATGQNLYWRAAHSGGPVALTTVTDPKWQVQLTGDFDGDGHADLLWRHSTSGAAAIWRAGNYSNQQAMTTLANPAWQIAGAGDFDGDGKTDVLWRDQQTGANAIWKNASYQNRLPVTGVTDLNWKIAGVADFNNDGKADILWRHATQGRNTIWLSGNSATQLAVDTVAATWKVAALGDFNGDGRADLAWRNSNTGANLIWRGARSSDVDDIVDVTGLQWSIAAAGDYDADGRDDLLWRNGSTGANVIWRSARYNSQRPVALLATTWSALR